MERTWGALAGLGWIGKNMMLIHPQHGSYFLLGFALLNQKVERGPSLLKDYCGSCARCLNQCPTQAFTQPRELNSNRCISYWTLEKRGPLDLDLKDRAAIGNRVAGCDVCQEVCPFNQKAEKLAIQSPASDDPLLPWTWEDLLSESVDEYKRRVSQNSLERIKPADFQRNLNLIRSRFPQELDK